MSTALRSLRLVEPELLDAMLGTDPRAVRARRDLRRINRIMSARSILCHGIDRATRSRPPSRIVEFGGGDGTLLLRIARGRAKSWPGVEATVVDRQDLVASSTRDGFAALGWKLRVVASDVFDWIEQAPAVPQDLAIANLFLHHFAGDALSRLLSGVAARTAAFVACEPRRAPMALLGSHLVGLLGCNAITRNDAVASVRAGFRDSELTAAWPDALAWRTDEFDAGLFSHCFVASRVTQWQP